MDKVLLRKIAVGSLIVGSIGMFASATILERELRKMLETQRRDAASREYAHVCIRDKIFAGGYSGMTPEQIDAKIREDYKFFVLTGRTDLDSELGK